MRNILITGANRGLGFATVQRILQTINESNKDDYRLILGSRSEKNALTAISELRDSFPLCCEMVPLLIDVSRPSSVFRASNEFRKQYSSCDVLICNAGILPMRGFDYAKAFTSVHGILGQQKGLKTEDDLGLVFSSNIFGHFILFNELLELIPRGSGKVVWVSSRSAYTNSISFDDIQGLKTDDPYGSSKALMDLISAKINSMDLGITSFVLCPGFVFTGIGEALPFAYLLYYLVNLLGFFTCFFHGSQLAGAEIVYRLALLNNTTDLNPLRKYTVSYGGMFGWITHRPIESRVITTIRAIDTPTDRQDRAWKELESLSRLWKSRFLSAWK